MNKKLLICGAIATSLLLSACVKKETPAEEEPRAEATTKPSQPEAKFENLSPTEPAQPAPAAEEVAKPAAAPQKVEVIREQTANTTTEIRRETRPAPAAEPKPQPKLKAEAPKAEAPKAEPKPKAEAPRSNSTQSQDDAVAAAIAAATPALD